jgi:hypothetical protein
MTGKIAAFTAVAATAFVLASPASAQLYSQEVAGAWRTCSYLTPNLPAVRNTRDRLGTVSTRSKMVGRGEPCPAKYNSSKKTKRRTYDW